MKKNVGSIDRTIRIVVALVISGLVFANVLSGTLGIVLLGISLALVASSFMSFCPLYSILGLSSCPVKSK